MAPGKRATVIYRVCEAAIDASHGSDKHARLRLMLSGDVAITIHQDGQPEDDAPAFVCSVADLREALNHIENGLEVAL